MPFAKTKVFTHELKENRELIQLVHQLRLHVRKMVPNGG